MKQYEISITTTQRVTVEANTLEGAKAQAVDNFNAMTGMRMENIKRVTGMEIATPILIIGA